MQSDIHRVRALGKAGVADPREIGDDARAYARLVGVLPEVAVVPRASGRCARGVPLSGNFKGRQKAMTSTKTNSKTRRLPLHLDATLAKARSEQQHAVRQVIVRADPGSRLLDEHRRVHQHAHGSSRSITFNGEYLMETMTAGGNGDDDGDQQSLGKAGSVVTLLEQFDTARDAMKGGCGSMSSVVDGTLTNGNATTITGTTISHRDVNKDVTYAKKYTNKYISMNADEHLQQPRQLTESHPWPLASPCGRGDLLRELESFIARANVIDDVDVVEEDAATKDTTEDAAAAKTTNVVDTVEDMNTNFKDADSRLRIYTAIFHRLITAFPTSGPTLTRLERAYTRTLALIPRERSELRALQRQVQEVCGLDANRREIEVERVRGAGLEREVRELSALNVRYYE